MTTIAFDRDRLPRHERLPDEGRAREELLAEIDTLQGEESARWRDGFVSGAVLAFAHTLGEFGVVLMVGGNIPGETRVVSIAIYDHVETLDYGAAHSLSLLLLAFAFAVLLATFAWNRNRTAR